MKARITINICGVKVKEYETEYKPPNIAGFLKEMRELGIKTKCSISIQRDNGHIDDKAITSKV